MELVSGMGDAPGLADGKGGLAGAGGVDGALLLLLAAALLRLRSGYQLHTAREDMLDILVLGSRSAVFVGCLLACRTILYFI